MFNEDGRLARPRGRVVVASTPVAVASTPAETPARADEPAGGRHRFENLARERDVHRALELLVRRARATVDARVGALALAAARRGPRDEQRAACASASRVRDTWTQLVAHELRQPIGAVLLALGPVAASRDPEAVAAAQRIRKAMQRLERMVGDLLDEAAVRAGSLRVAVDAIDLRAAAARAIADVARDDPRRRVELLAPVGGLPFVRADVCRIEQVLANLLSNAVKYGEPGAPIRVRLERRGDEVLTSVTNRGRPLGVADQRRIFELSYRTRSARTGPATGLGLGLFIARSIVESHGGRIVVESRGGETTFRFTLPVARSPRGTS